ncbi:alpha/beta fold hydrolase [Kineococcus sp. SYSU DK001]|uniref:alpha/beta fold hydrolase n=1 Tax=Kineococcus sp. SYSU DK001 TaxID=3383122 RepID=UPI003D7EB62B
MPSLDLRGTPTHVETAGAGEPLVLLHGGFCSLETMRPIGEALTDTFAVHAAERPGHGRTPDRQGPFSYDDGVLDTLALLDAQGIGRAHLVGFSDGGVIALLLAIRHPERVRSVVAISANLSPEGIGGHEVPQNTEAMARMRAEHEALSPDGPEHTEVVLAKLTELWAHQPQIPVADLARIGVPALVVAGEHDVVDREHTRSIAAGIAGAREEIVAGTTHLLVVERPDEVTRLVRQFLADAAAPGA